VRIVARRTEGFAHDVEIEGGHVVRVDEPADAGGTDTGPSPTRLLAASLAGCIAITVEMYAERTGWDLGAIEVEVDVGYDGPAPTSFDVGLKLPAGLDDEQRRRLLVIATKCPVHKALAGGAHVSVNERRERA
jgi:putative redox protein